MAEASDVTQVVDKLDTLNVDSQNLDTPQSSISIKSDNDLRKDSKTGSESGSVENLEAKEQPCSETVADLAPAVKLKTSLAQKSRNLSAKDKAKIAEMVKGLAKFKHAEEEIAMESKTAKQKPNKEKKAKKKELDKETEILGESETTFKPLDWEKADIESDAPKDKMVIIEKKDKGKKEKKKELKKEMDNEDEWEDVESEDEVSLPPRQNLTDNIIIHVGDKRSATIQPKAQKSPQRKAQKSPKSKAEKEQKSPQVGSYTKLLQSVGGRIPAVGIGSNFKMNSAYKEEYETRNQPDPWSPKALKSRKRAEAHQLLLEQSATQGAGRASSQDGKRSESGGDGGVKLSHKEQAKLRSEMFKLSRQNEQPPRSESPGIQERPAQPVLVKGAKFYRTTNDPAQTETADGNLVSRQPQENPVSNKKKRKEKKKKKQEQMATYTPKVSPDPPLTTPTKAPTPAVSAEVLSPEMSEVKIRVPKADHRFIVGVQRRNLTEIQNLTGVSIEVPKVNDDSEEVVLRGDKFQIGPAITLMYTKCEVSRAEGEQKQRTKEFLQSQMAFPQGATHQALSLGQNRPDLNQGQGHQTSSSSQVQGQQRPGSGQGQHRPGSGQRRGEVQGQKVMEQGQQGRMSGQGKGGVRGQNQKVYVRSQRGELPLQYQGQGQFQEFLPYKSGSQGNKGQSQRYAPQMQGQRQESQKGKSQGQGDKRSARGQGQGQNKKQENRPKKTKREKPIKIKQPSMQPLLYGSEAYLASFSKMVRQWDYDLREINRQNVSVQAVDEKHSKPKEAVAKPNKPFKRKKLRHLVEQPLLCDSVWLQQGNYEAAEAHYQKFLAGPCDLKLSNGPRQTNLVLIAYASSEGSGEPAHPRSLARTFAARSYKQ